VDPKSTRAANSVATALLRLGRRREAVAELRRSLAIDPDQGPIRELLAEAERDESGS
jgi:predicted Zn-dependent protease